MWPLLNIFFFVFHTAFTLFNLFGWLWMKARRAHLVTMGLTAFSWLVLGIWYGWGYCVCTEWHWQVREAMGLFDQSDSYIHFLILNLTGYYADPLTVDIGTAIGFAVAAAGSIWSNFFRKA
ncbi:MAG: DUF2784 family protein [Cyclobacteriaceae bacterium]|jgi:hypothetical protein